MVKNKKRELKRKMKLTMICLVVMFMGGIASTICTYADEILSYEYTIDEYGNEMITGFEYEGEKYWFEYDERAIIKYICDAEGKRLAYYECDEIGNVTNVFSSEETGWEINKDEKFIGNINKVRWLGYEYLEEVGCYLIGDMYFDVEKQVFLDGEDNSFAYVESNPFSVIEDGIMMVDSYYSDLEAEEWSNALLKDSGYGKAISYSSGWYNNLTTVELLARCIYCEGGTAYTNEENAVAWVILNRVKDSAFPSTSKGVITASGQFASVTGNKGQTEAAREPLRNSTRWKHSTYLACLLLTTTDTVEWQSLVPSPISGQLYFYSYTTAKNNGGSPFSGASSNSLYYNSKRIKDVYVLGYGAVSSFNTLFNNYSPTQYSRNIYYNYY